MWISKTATFLNLLSITSALDTPTSNELQIEILETRVCSHKTQPGDTISVHYNGTLLDGLVFDSSYARNNPFTFVLGAGRVIKGWDQGLLDMCIGDIRRLTIPPSMAYGSRAMGKIPADSVLVFGTKLMGIQGYVEEQQPPRFAGFPKIFSTTATDSTPTASVEDKLIPTPTAAFHIATIVASENETPTATAEPDLATQKKPPPPAKGDPNGPGAENGECRLLGPFALLVQAGLGALALLSLVFKRWRERPRRPVKVWAFDASKQVFGSVLLHILNLLMSMFSSGDFELATSAHVGTAQLVAAAAASGGDPKGPMPNPCSFYLVNLAIDTTLGIPILVLLLRILHALFTNTPLGRPAGSLKSGNYGTPPHATWWLKQAVLYFLALFLMKLCVFIIFQLLPWIAWVGDWALRWTEGSEALQITFVMFVFPLVMNAAQYYIIDGFIKDPSAARDEQGAGPGQGGESRYVRVAEGDDGEGLLDSDEEAEGRGPREARYGDDSASSGSETLVDKRSGNRGAVARTKEVEDAKVDAKVLFNDEEDEEEELGRKGKGAAR